MLKMPMEMNSIRFESTLKLRSCLHVRARTKERRGRQGKTPSKKFHRSSLEKATKAMTLQPMKLGLPE